VVVTKFCKSCRLEKPLTEFHHSYKNKDKRKTYPDTLCKSCKSIQTKTWFQANKEKAIRYNTKSKLKLRYGMDMADYDAMVIAQNNLCAICNQPQARRNLAVDHCHQTNRVRGLLCDKCNLALGMINDDLNIVEGIKRYLLLHTAK
jgi:hypothetical protein